MEKFRDKYRIPSARLQNWDYGWNAPYFITICTAKRECYFGEIWNGEMQLSNIGILADVFWHEIKNHAHNVELDAFVVMPNHIHGIIILDGNNGDCGGGCDCGGGGDGCDCGGGGDGCDCGGGGGGCDCGGGGGCDCGGGGGCGRDKACLVSTTNHRTNHRTNQTTNPSKNQSSKPVKKTIGQKRFQNQGKNTLSSIIGSYKSAVTKHANRLGLCFAWQSRFHEHIIRNNESYQRIRKYIINNPLNWKDDVFIK